MLKKPALLIMLALTIAFISGCGGDPDTQAQQPPNKNSLVQVEKVEGNTVTAIIGEYIQSPDEIQNFEGDGNRPATPPEGAEGRTPPEGAEGGTPPEGAEGGTPPDLNDGNGPDRTSGSPLIFSVTGAQFTFQVPDDISIMVEVEGGTQVGSMEDVLAGSILEITMDADNNVTGITVKSRSMGGRRGQPSDFPNNSDDLNSDV